MKQFAPGLPDMRNYGDLTALRPGRLYTLLRQLHQADRAGRHTDVRIGAPQLGMYSWAAPKDFPQPGQKKLFIRTPVHTYAYNDYQGPIGSGYGKGMVHKLQQSNILMLQNTPNKLRFVRSDVKNSPVYTMIRTKNGNWLTMVQKQDASTAVKAYNKQHFKSIPVQKIADMMDQNSYTTPKIDGAGALAQIGPHDIQVYSIRKDKNGNLIRYTDYIGGLRDLNPPAELVGKVLRAEVTGTQEEGTLGPNEVASYLNSTLTNSLNKQKQNNAALHLNALAVAGQQDNYDQQAVNKLVKLLNTPKIQGLPIYNRSQTLKQLALMRSGKHPLTQQGVVLQQPGKRPLKAKLTQDHDVVVQDVFPAQTTTGPARAGGFQYSLPGSTEPVGRVGTGFDRATLVQMLLKPELYKGRQARIKAQGQYQSGAYRAPSFIAMRTQGD